MRVGRAVLPVTGSPAKWMFDHLETNNFSVSVVAGHPWIVLRAVRFAACPWRWNSDSVQEVRRV